MSDLTVKRKCGMLLIGGGGGNVGTAFYNAGYGQTHSPQKMTKYASWAIPS